MKKVILSVLLLGIIMGLQAQELKVINLNKPDKSRNVTDVICKFSCAFF